MLLILVFIILQQSLVEQVLAKDLLIALEARDHLREEIVGSEGQRGALLDLKIANRGLHPLGLIRTDLCLVVRGLFLGLTLLLGGGRTLSYEFALSLETAYLGRRGLRFL